MSSVKLSELAVKPGTRPDLARNFRGTELPDGARNRAKFLCSPEPGRTLPGTSGGRNFRPCPELPGDGTSGREPELPGHGIQIGPGADGRRGGGGRSSRGRGRPGAARGVACGRLRARARAGRGRPRRTCSSCSCGSSSCGKQQQGLRPGAGEAQTGRRRPAAAAEEAAGGGGGGGRRRGRRWPATRCTELRACGSGSGRGT
jgi:hypothetical protein